MVYTIYKNHTPQFNLFNMYLIFLFKYIYSKEDKIMQVHKQLNKKIEDNKLTSHLDFLRFCNEHGFTDLLFTKLDLKIKPKSKYLITININNKPIIIFYPNFSNYFKTINLKYLHLENLYKVLNDNNKYNTISDKLLFPTHF